MRDAAGVETLRIEAADGYGLGASLYRGGNGHCVIVNSALGVRRRFYGAFAGFLAGRGFSVITYDYRGIGDSAPPSLRRFDAGLYDWGERDFDAVLRFAADRLGSDAVSVVGHSVGGQIVGLADSADRVCALVAVASQSGYWKHWHGGGRAMMFALWHVLVPVSARLFGRLPGWMTGGVDVPRRVAVEWARAGRQPGYIRGRHRRASDRNFSRMRGDVLAFSITDDPYAPRPAVEALMEWYGADRRDLRVLSPADAGVRSIGHFGWFREGCGRRAWEDVARWLTDRRDSTR